MERHGLLQATYGAYGQPAGYYAGRGEPFGGGNPAEFKAWLAKNQHGIDEIQNRIVEIKDGKRTPGCIGEDKLTCVATLAQKLAIADRFDSKEFNIFPEDEYDVNGKPINGFRISLDGYAPNANLEHLIDTAYNVTRLYLDLGPDGSVSRVAAQLPKDPTFAQTQAEYDATGMYEIMWAAAAKSCPNLDRAEVAKWFENTIKPHAKVGAKQTWSEPERGHGRDVLAWKASLCGRTFDFRAFYGAYAEGFQHHDFGGMTLTVH